uniref:Uncharacterized protein n=1 Tax=uncultured prokaryote TaxID=198431 RepID=A0A0H5Q4W4_9ZZZZ|nr:hypothetical protein [uncultured prokaryote]
MSLTADLTTNLSPPSRVREAGVDSARFLWHLTDERHQEHAAALTMNGAVGLDGLNVGYFPAYEMLWVEGRPVQAINGEGCHDLLPASAVGDAHRAIEKAVADRWGYRGKELGVSRIDVTATLEFNRPADGWAMLRGLGALDAPRRKAAIYLDQSGRRPETVYWMTGRGAKKERAYDKGAEAGIAAPGHLVRLEAQTRWTKQNRRAVGAWKMEDVRSTFEQRFAPMARAAEGVKVCSEITLREQVRDMVNRDIVTPTKAQDLLGYIASESVGIHTPARTAQRRRADLRRLGLLHALDGLESAAEPLDVPLGELLAEAVVSDRW